MKTPKVGTPKPKPKFNTPKSGLVRKSLSQTSTKSLKKLSSKGTEQVLSFFKDNEDNIEFKTKTPKKLRMSLPANISRKASTSPADFLNGKTPIKSPKFVAEKSVSPEVFRSGRKNSVHNITSKKSAKSTSPIKKENKQNTVKKTPLKKTKSKGIETPVSVENNTSPIKQHVDSKMAKVPFILDDSLITKTPNRLQEKTIPNQSKLHSPEVELGLQLEEALSPKSKKGKKKKNSISGKLVSLGKVEVSKNNVNMPISTDSKKKSRRRNKKLKIKEKVERKPSILSYSNAMNAVNALLNVPKPTKTDLLDSDQYIYLQFCLIKLPKEPRGVFKVVLPHSILPDSPEVCLITPDLKGKRNDPEEAIDHYKEVLKQNGITAITEIIPLRKLKQEYSQFEEINKLNNRLDCIISDGRITQVGRLGKRFARSKKCICPINFSSKTLKGDVEKALRKVAIFSSGKGTSFTVKCGRRGMSVEDIANNIVAIAEFLANNGTLVGEPKNISTVSIKTALSSAFPVFVSTVTPNEVEKPKGKEKQMAEPIEDEVTTVQNATVVVYPSGNVKVKKRKNEEDNDGIGQKLKQQAQKKAKMNINKMEKDNTNSDESTVDEESDEGSEGDEVLYSSDKDTSDVENSLNGIKDEDVSEDEANNEDHTEDDDSEMEEDEDDDDNSLEEEEIEAVEKEYLEELRKLQDEINDEKGKSGVKGKEGDKKQKQINPQSKKGGVKGQVKDKKGIQIDQKVKIDPEKEQLRNKFTKVKRLGKQNNARGFQNQFQKNKKGGSPHQSPESRSNKFHQRKGSNSQSKKFQKTSPMQGKKQKFQNKKGVAGKNRN